jgi:hypothetical protein
MGYALAEYPNGSDSPPVYSPWIPNYIDHFRNVVEPKYASPGLAIQPHLDLPSSPGLAIQPAKDCPSSKDIGEEIPPSRRCKRTAPASTRSSRSRKKTCHPPHKSPAVAETVPELQGNRTVTMWVGVSFVTLFESVVLYPLFSLA